MPDSDPEHRSKSGKWARQVGRAIPSIVSAIALGTTRGRFKSVRYAVGAAVAKQLFEMYAPKVRARWPLIRRLAGLDSPVGSIDPDDTADPIALFHVWFEEAERSESHVPDAMNLATMSADGRPRSRMMLLKGADENGFQFYTNRRSDKGVELAKHAWAALCFHWKTLERQVRIEGEVFELSAVESDTYWKTRPRGSQLGAWASDQSREIESRQAQDDKLIEAAAEFGDRPIPRPEHWGGYRVVPLRIEFWQGQHFRFHDRWCFDRDDPNTPWRRRRLQP